MRKTARLDQILFRLGFADQDQITRALRRQATHGGRLGRNLVELGVITERQLFAALAEQFGIPTLEPEERSISKELVARMPADVVAGGLAVPLSWNEQQRVLSLAVANPADEETVRRVQDAFDAKGVRVALAPDRLLASLGARLAPAGQGGTHKIVLPELFATEAPDDGGETERGEHEEAPSGNVLMVTAAASRGNFLPPLFHREGRELTVVSTLEEVRAELGATDYQTVLLSSEMVEAFSAWVAQGRIPSPSVEVVVFSSVSGALLENPLPYDATSASLRSAVQALADYRCAQLGASPPYGLIAADVMAMAERHRMRRVAMDGLHLGVHLLLPAQVAPTIDPVGTVEPFAAFASSLELATRIRFPWKLDALLAACYALFSGRADPSDCRDWPAETVLAAQILSITWYRHNHVPALIGTDEERMIGLRTRLREKGGRLATQELIEGYLRLIADRGGVTDTQGDRQVLLLGAERIDRSLTPALGRVGREVITTDDLADAQTIAERRPPAAIVIDHEEFPTQVDKFSRVTKLGGAALLFVLTDSTDPSLVLNLLDVGVDDVFGPPHDFDLVAARINRAIRSRSRDRSAEASQAGQFSATFEVFSFLDLIQMLSQGLKTVRIDLSRPESDPAVIYMQKGRLTHAKLGDIEGERAVHEVIAWEDEGEFTVRQETRFPEATIDYPTESVLMEGLRLLDESKR
jgi:hypothetical protein